MLPLSAGNIFEIDSRTSQRALVGNRGSAHLIAQYVHVEQQSSGIDSVTWILHLLRKEGRKKGGIVAYIHWPPSHKMGNL